MIIKKGKTYVKDNTLVSDFVAKLNADATYHIVKQHDTWVIKTKTAKYGTSFENFLYTVWIYYYKSGLEQLVKSIMIKIENDTYDRYIIDPIKNIIICQKSYEHLNKKIGYCTYMKYSLFDFFTIELINLKNIKGNKIINNNDLCNTGS